MNTLKDLYGSRTKICSKSSCATKIIYCHGRPRKNIGNCGDIYVDLSNGNIYYKNEFGWIFLQSLFEPFGPQCTMIGNVYSGEGEPFNNMGSDDDLYINMTTGYYYIKINGQWIRKCNISSFFDDYKKVGIFKCKKNIQTFNPYCPKKRH